MRVFLIVLDSVGVGAAPDADEYGDKGANTLAHTAQVAGPLRLPALEKMGLGNAASIVPESIPIPGLAGSLEPSASFGVMEEFSEGKDTITGHWEIAGLALRPGFKVFPREFPSFPERLTESFEAETGRKIAGNCAASGTEIIEELGERQMREGCWIVYTSADSALQVAAHEDIIPLEELYRACAVARRLCDEYRVGRVIARPFIGAPGHFRRTGKRRDYPFPLPEPTILDRLEQHGIPVVSVGKIDDIFSGRGISRSIHLLNNDRSQSAVLELAESKGSGLVFANLIDFDMLYGHRRDPEGYGRALEDTDRFFENLVAAMQPEDVLIVTSDHGNDPTFRGTDHTREYVPLLLYRRDWPARSLEIRKGFFDVAQTVAHLFRVPAMPRGRSIVEEVSPSG